MEQSTVRLHKRWHKPKGRYLQESELQQVTEIIGNRSLEHCYLIENLHALHDYFGQLTKGSLHALARLMNLPQAAVYEVATFYHHFEIVEDGQTPPLLIARVCVSLSCELAGALELYTNLVNKYGASSKSTMSDNSGVNRFELKIVQAPCVGRCAAAPVVVAGQKVLENCSLLAAETYLDGALAEGEALLDQHGASPENLDRSLLQCTQPDIPNSQDYLDYVKSGGYGLYKQLREQREQPEQAKGSPAARIDEPGFAKIINALNNANLRGLGGAGFPVSRKWGIVRSIDSEQKILAVNIDEGEPGTFKDRYFLEKNPHQFLEGALIAAWAIGCQRMYIYLRDEYHGARRMLSSELDKLITNADFALPQIELRRGAGAYICGEESAMIESIEGKRGEPRLRPPYIAQTGVFNLPTLEHNMETLYWLVPIILDEGKEFANSGANGRVGLRSFSLSGRVNNPGVHIAPAGISVRELIENYGGGMVAGHEFYAYLPGGASGGILPASMGDIPLDFEVITEHSPYAFIGSAAVIVLSDQDRACDAAKNVMAFFADESCGQCTPCRVGTKKALDLMCKDIWAADELEDLCRLMADSSICGLGQAAPNPIRCVLKYFTHELAHMNLPS